MQQDNDNFRRVSTVERRPSIECSSVLNSSEKQHQDNPKIKNSIAKLTNTVAKSAEEQRKFNDHLKTTVSKRKFGDKN